MQHLSEFLLSISRGDQEPFGNQLLMDSHHFVFRHHQKRSRMGSRRESRMGVQVLSTPMSTFCHFHGLQLYHKFTVANYYS